MDCCGTLQKNGKNCTRESKSCPYHRRRSSSRRVSSKRNSSKSVSSAKYRSKRSSSGNSTKSSSRPSSKEKKPVEIVKKYLSFSEKYQKYKKERVKINRIDLNIDSLEINKNNKVAIIVPYRDNGNNVRANQLKIFLEHYHSYIPNLKIFIIEQSQEKDFNRGILLNIGFKLAKKEGFETFIFHDVDLLSPEELKPLYSFYPFYPVHIAKLWTSKYKFEDFFGGILSINSEDYIKTNGYPNNFYAWGKEDDSLYNRLVKNKIPLFIPKSKLNISIEDLEHPQEKEGLGNKAKLLEDLKSWKKNGLNSLKYKTLEVKKLKYKNCVKFTIKI